MDQPERSAERDREVLAEIRKLIDELREMTRNAMTPPTARWDEISTTPQDAIERVREAMARDNDRGHIFVPVVPSNVEPPNTAHSYTVYAGAIGIERLCWLLGMCEQERAFVMRAMQDPSDFLNLQVFADWLEDEGRTEEGIAIRKLSPESGDVILIGFQRGPHGGVPPEVIEAAYQMKTSLHDMGKEVTVACVPDTVTKVEYIGSRELEGTGWVRGERIRAEVERVMRMLMDEMLRRGADTIARRDLGVVLNDLICATMKEVKWF